MPEVKEAPQKLYRSQLQLKDGDIIPQPGMQEETLLSTADLTIIGGSRGSGKSYSLILDPLYDTHNPNFTAICLRKETSQLSLGGGLYDKAAKIYPLLGAKGTKLKFVFPSGASITYDHLVNETEREIEKRFKGLEVPGIYIDELDQISFGTLLKLMQSNRNASGIRNRIIGTCNPAPDSYLRNFLDWYINEDGFIDPERDRKTRYFYVYGTDVNEIIWGNSREETYERAKHYIDKSYNEKFAAAGITKFDAIKSLKFIRGDLADNPILLKSQPTYYANVAQGGAAAIARNLEGNWNVKQEGSEMVSRSEMEEMFYETRAALRTGKKYMSIDVALLGIDKFVCVIWDGMHIEDVVVKSHITSSEAFGVVRGLMFEYGIREENLVYDYTGNGQSLNDLKHAFPVKPQQPPIGKENNYDNIKSQILYVFGRMLIEKQITCSTELANRLFDYGKGGKKERITFKEIMQNERRALMIAESSGKTKMLSKKDMKKIIGTSPDFLEAVAYRVVFELDKKKSGGFVGLQWL